MSTRPQKPSLYALLVAINQYNDPIPPLQGCVNDLEKMSNYLEKEHNHFAVNIKKLVNEEATKEAIVSQFINHLGQATNGEVAFFYFSGHGTQEDADPVFWSIEEDRKLEALVCFDSYARQGANVRVNLLADKELRYLIHQIAPNGAHILTVFDCCHSGGNTRNSYITELAEVREKRVVIRDRLSQAFPMRHWKDFIFSETITYEEAQKQNIGIWLPEGQHIQIAACQNDQSAFEVKGEGVFTRNLLEVLSRCEGDITYYDLQSRIQQYLKHQFDQTPKIYVVGDEESALFQGFLHKKPENKPLYGNINYNASLGWIMDLGAMHGISQMSNLKVLTLDEQQDFDAKVYEVYPTYCQIMFDDDPPSIDSSYKGYCPLYLSLPLGVFLNIQEERVKDKLLQFISKGNPHLHIMKAAYEADFCVQYIDEHLYLSRPGTLSVPVTQPRKYTSDSDLLIIQNYLNHLSKFEYIKSLHNPNAYLFRRDPVEANVLRRFHQQEVPVQIIQGELLLDFDQPDHRQHGGSIRIVLKNTSDRKLYCALLYLSFYFGVSVKLLKEVVVGLEPNREVWALDGAPIGLMLEEEVRKYNYPESISYLKLIVSTMDFQQEVTRFEMPPLPGPSTSATKGFDLGVEAYHPDNIEDWTTRLITVKIKNPFYRSEESS